MKIARNLGVLALFAFSLTCLRLSAQIVQVTPANLGSWSFTTYSVNNDGSVSICNDPVNCGSGSMVFGPTGQPYGQGSANLHVSSSNFNPTLPNADFSGATLLGTTAYSGLVLSALTSLSYYTYDTANNGSQFPYLEIGISYTGVAGDPTQTPGTDQLIFEPPYQQTSTGNPSLPNQNPPGPTLNTWQKWNALVGGWWDNNGVVTPGTGVEPLSYFESYYNNVKIIADPTTNYTISFAVGFADQDTYNGYVDGFAIGTSSGTTTYDFDPTPPLSVACPAGTGQIGVPYLSTLAASGGIPGYTYSISSGSLPPGLTLNPSTGVITGVPTAAGSYPFVLEVTDSTGSTATASCGIFIAPPPLLLSCAPATIGQVGVPYNSSLTPAGGVPPYTFFLNSGSLPLGLNLNATTGAITGTPTTAGSYPFSAEVIDSAGSLTTAGCGITIAPVGYHLECPTSTTGQVDSFYDASLVAVGGVPPYTYSISSGSLPLGLMLNSTTGAITGTPTTAGSYPFVAEVTDSTAATAFSSSCGISIGSLPISCITRYAANLQSGESFIDITNTGANGVPLYGPGISTAVGNICVNVYTVDPGEELISCCSCLVTPDETVNLGVNRDLTSNVAVGGVAPSSVTVKLCATLAGPAGANTSCNYSAASVSLGTLAGGIAAWGTTLHGAPPGGYATTETPFTAITPSAGDLASLSGRCASIMGNASGFGICASCRAGALGGQNLF